MRRIFGAALNVALALGLAACQEATEPTAPESFSGTPSENFNLTERQRAELIRRGNEGELGAMQALIQYYALVNPNDESVVYWGRRAARRGDTKAMLTLATYLSIQPTQPHCLEAQQWVKEAIKTAEDPKTRKSAALELEIMRTGRHGHPCGKWLN